MRIYYMWGISNLYVIFERLNFDVKSYKQEAHILASNRKARKTNNVRRESITFLKCEPK